MDEIIDAESADAPGDREPNTALRRWFFARRAPVWRYVLRMWLTSLVGALLIGLLVTVAFPSSGREQPDFGDHWFAVIFGVVIFSPLVETLLMGPIFWLLRRAIQRSVPLAVASAIVWGGFHSALLPAWGLTVAWPFFVFSCAYLAWRPAGWGRAVAVTASIHALHNALPAIVILVAS